MAETKRVLAWESEVVRSREGEVRVVARTPVETMSTKQAATVLGVSTWTVSDLWRAGLLEGTKPGAKRPRMDGKGSNARLILDAASVLHYKAECEAQGRAERGL